MRSAYDLRPPDHQRAPVARPRPNASYLGYLIFLITLQRAYIAGVRRKPACQRKRRATPKSLLLLRLVPRLDRDHGPEDLQEPEADEE